MSDATARDDTRHGRFWPLMFGCCAAPIFWLGQLGLSYWISAEVCYGSDHPTVTASPGALHTMLIVFDVVAIAAALAGGLVSLQGWRAPAGTVTNRDRFMALWGIMSSLWFLGAVVFNTIGSLLVPLCPA